ncbi:efflux RND transporter permease subunit [Mesorhizobium sp. Root172]|uniref:efflux RND transporter permease subunit n=1 Tax=Mesorhizobium sp. Root172 TaxID=1736481 RepID=UPI0006FC6ED5|nr:efflux RND transporter permease subunit [Mesorhizobium sp. Root172]KRB30185.1 hypothetical protein ASE05_29770 [Mesorhizobium sp. Root172]
MYAVACDFSWNEDPVRGVIFVQTVCAKIQGPDSTVIDNQRFREVLMTALAFIFGVLPLATSTGAGADARQAVGATIIGGMLGGDDCSDLHHPNAGCGDRAYFRMGFAQKKAESDQPIS